MTTDKILDKLSKMKAAQHGEAKLGNTAAAEAFAEAINRLLIQHELSAEDIPLGGPKEDPIVEVTVDLASHGVKATKARVGWQEVLASVVADAHLCRFLVTPGCNVITFVGTKAHATVAEYAYGTLAASAWRMSREARDAYWRDHRDEPDFESGNFRAAWIQGFVVRISERFREARAAEVAATANPGTALMRLDQALVRAKQHVADKYKTKAAATSMGTGCLAGRQAGRAAADAIALGRKGVSEGGQRKLGS